MPHIDGVMPHLPRDLHPLTVQALLTQPQPSSVVDGRPVSIVAWLTGTAGRSDDVEHVVDVLIATEWEVA